MARFVVVVDTQADFMAADGALAVAGADALVAPMRDFLRALDPADVAGVLFTFDTHEPAIYARSAEAAKFAPHCVKGTPGWENMLDPALVPAGIPVWRLEKGVFAMWEEAELAVEPVGGGAGAAADRDAFFAALRKRVTEVTVIGVAADYCVRWAIDGLVARGFRVTVPAALTRGIAAQIDAVAADFPAGTVAVV